MGEGACPCRTDRHEREETAVDDQVLFIGGDVAEWACRDECGESAVVVPWVLGEQWSPWMPE